MHRRLNRSLPLAAVGLFTLAISVPVFAGEKAGFVAHEWGTFTSVQGGDGVLLDWRPLETSHLPKFVYDWGHPGANRLPTGQFFVGKGMLSTLQRMETPVIYFYSDKDQAVDVSVKFPHGLITEWYPQVDQIGPASVLSPPALARLDNYAHHAGVSPQFTLASLLHHSTFPDSRARWAHLEILSTRNAESIIATLPLDSSGSHYFAARDTDANLLATKALVSTNPTPEHEKFIFYRGVGNFQTPLRVTMSSSDFVTLANTGTEPLEHLLVLGLRNQNGKFITLEHLAAGETKTVTINLQDKPVGLEQLTRQVGDRVAGALVTEGLYRREAQAMVSTWKDSWFCEDGVRVLYVLPRAWTDRTLPLTISPAPRELVRIMVGRAEVLAPTREQQLAADLDRASHGDTAAREHLLADFKKLGRFAEPALRLAAGQNARLSQTGWQLLQAAAADSRSAKL